MTVKCPKHNADLEIEYTSIDILGNRYPVVTGQCPKCKIKYLSREIMSCNGSFKIAGQAYEYLNEMEIAYPYPFKPLSQQSSVSDTPLSEPLKELVPDVDYTNTKTQIQKNKQEKLSKEEKKEKQQQDRIEATRKKLATGQGKVFHVHKLSYPSIMPRVCSKDGEELFYVAHVMIDMANSGIMTKAWCCLKCKTAYIPKEDQIVIRERLRQTNLRENSNTNIILQKITSDSASNEPINLAVPQNTLYICKGLISCNRNNHKVESATGILLSKSGQAIKINTNYCPQCRKYFISYDEYMHYRKLYGVLLGNFKITNGSFANFEANLAEESILHICGYSVNQTDNLSASVRQNILQYLIDSKVSNKVEVIDYLNFFIKRNGKKQNMTEAVRRWNEDLKWVREYQINSQRHFEIVNIQKNK